MSGSLVFAASERPACARIFLRLNISTVNCLASVERCSTPKAFWTACVLAHAVERPFAQSYGDLNVRFQSLRSFADSISAPED